MDLILTYEVSGGIKKM